MSKRKPRKRAVNNPTSRAADAAPAEVCFVIMPFGGWFDDYYEGVYRPAIEAVGLAPHRADDLYRPSIIVNDIWAYTRRAKLLIGDLTGKNPNVFYELGLAHALAKPVILVAESMDDIPFDLRALRVIVYDKNAPRWGQLLQEKVESAIKEVLAAPQEAVLPAFLQLRESSSTPKVTPGEKDVIQIKQELDLLRREVRRSTLELAPPPTRTMLDSGDAIHLIRRYLEAGFPPDKILQSLAASGLPPSWIIGKIKEVSQGGERAKAPPVHELSPEAGPAEKMKSNC